MTLARVTVGIPMEPNTVGAVFEIRQITADVSGEKPRPTSMLAGIATAVPKPAIPSMKPAKHQPIRIARTRLSADTLVIICLITSIAPVLSVRLYVNIAAIITRMIGQIPNSAPSSIALSASISVMLKKISARIKQIPSEDRQDKLLGHFSTHSAMTSQMIGTSARIKARTGFI